MIRKITEHQFEGYVIKSEMPLVLIHYYTNYSPNCRDMEPIIDNIARKYSSYMDVVQINIEDEIQLAAMANVNGAQVPVFVFFKPNAPHKNPKQPQPVYRHNGMISEYDLEVLIRRYIG